MVDDWMLQIQHTDGNLLLTRLNMPLKLADSGLLRSFVSKRTALRRADVVNARGRRHAIYVAQMCERFGEERSCTGEMPQLEKSMETMKKVAVVTGGSSGIGKAAALGLAEAGFAVAICGRRADALRAVAEATAGHWRPCDVSDPAAVAQFFAGVKEKYGRIDVVFNNAGRFAPATSFGDLDVLTWQEMVNTNLNGAFYVAREAFRAMRDQAPQGGRIINNGSISAYAPRPGAASYTATKHAITGLTKAISLDGRAFNIACGQIDIGNAATDMTSHMTSGSLQANGTMLPEPTFDVKHVVDALLYMAGLPLSANVQFMTVMATTMPYIGRG